MQVAANRTGAEETLSQGERDAQIELLLASRALRGSDALRGLLSFLANCARENPGTAPKEHLIATTVLGRPESFDPQSDPAVRVQIGRLRTKLTEYYAHEGQSDAVLVSIPRGSHSLQFARRPLPIAAALPQTAPRWTVLVLCGLAGALVSGVIVWLAMRPPAPDAALRQLWAPFLDQGHPPVVVFSNAEFVGSPRDGLRYFRRGEDQPEEMLDTYTGVGEVAAVRNLTLLFASFDHPLRVKRGRLLTWDEDRDSNLVFVGSPAENSEARRIAEVLSFRFKSRDLEPAVGRPGVSNLRVGTGESALYLVRQGRPITEDFALVALVPGITSGRAALLLAGCTTLGTGAASEFASQAKGAAELRARAKGARFFEALLHVRVDKGVPTQTRIVAFHARNDLGG